MRKLIIIVSFVFFAISSQAQTDLELALQNALNHCRNDYYLLADKYVQLDSATAKTTLILREQLSNAKNTIKHQESQISDINSKRKKQKRKEILLAVVASSLVTFFIQKLALQ